MPYKLWTPEEETQLKELVSTGKYSYRQIGTMMNRGINSVTCHARQYLDINNDKFENRKYQHNTSFFNQPNVVNCYVAGFLAADGNLTKLTKGFRLRLEVALEDEKHLDILKNFLGYTGSLHRWKNRNTKFFYINLSDEYAKTMEINFGLIPNKTHRLKPPHLDRFELRFAYMLGLLDGDGCIHINSLNKLMLTYTSSSLFAVEWIKDTLDSIGLPKLRNRRPFKIRDLRPQANAYSYACTGARIVCFIQLAQLFATKYNLPLLTRKWNNTRLNQYISDFYVRHPNFVFDPVIKLAQLI